MKDVLIFSSYSQQNSKHAYFPKWRHVQYRSSSWWTNYITRSWFLHTIYCTSLESPICTLLLFPIRPLRVSELDLHLTCPLPYQRNRTPVEYEAACSAHFNPRSAPLTSHHCPSALLALQHSVTQQPRAKVPLSDLGHVTDPLDKNQRPGSLQISKDKTIKPEMMFSYLLGDKNINGLLYLSGFQYNMKVCGFIFMSNIILAVALSKRHKTR